MLLSGKSVPDEYNYIILIQQTKINALYYPIITQY